MFMFRFASKTVIWKKIETHQIIKVQIRRVGEQKDLEKRRKENNSQYT